jgi:hypothetical protein
MSSLGKLFGLVGLALACIGFNADAQEQMSAEQQHAQQVIRSLNWIQSGTAQVGKIAQFEVPQGYGFLNPADTRKLVALLAAPKIWEVLRGQPSENAAYYQSSTATRLRYGVQYLGLVVLLAIMSFEVYRQLHPERAA